MKKPTEEPTGTTALERMAAFTKKLIAVPKDEIDMEAREYETRKRNGKRRRRAK
jgi:hypothetical protein